ncbi:MAG: FadR/GntR family transcriptional regulator [Hyphomicrobiaceae bacterium]|nr:FadR/GntR family transcriptional regulator [Hyphomicrobiaceae bacterium]
MPIEAIEPRRLYRQIADQLRQLIDRGEYPVGSRLPTERTLADLLGVSRPTVREALIALEVEGRVRIRVGSGIYVANPAQAAHVFADSRIEGPFEILRARKFIESAVAEEAARLASDRDIARLDAVLRLVPAALREGDQFLSLDRSFHTAIAAILGNSVLERSVGELFDLRINPYFERLARHTEDESSRSAALAEHIAIRDAIASRDPAAARAAMGRHLQNSQSRFERDLGETPDAAMKEEDPATRAAVA